MLVPGSVFVSLMNLFPHHFDMGLPMSIPTHPLVLSLGQSKIPRDCIISEPVKPHILTGESGDIQR